MSGCVAALRLVAVAALLGLACALGALAGAQAGGIAVLSRTASGPSLSLHAPGVVAAVAVELVGLALLVGAEAGRSRAQEEE